MGEQYYHELFRKGVNVMNWIGMFKMKITGESCKSGIEPSGSLSPTVNYHIKQNIINKTN